MTTSRVAHPIVVDADSQKAVQMFVVPLMDNVTHGNGRWVMPFRRRAGSLQSTTTAIAGRRSAFLIRYFERLLTQ